MRSRRLSLPLLTSIYKKMSDKAPPRSISLPETIKVFRNLNNAKRFAIDIGGSLTKIAYYSTVPCRKPHYSLSEGSGAPLTLEGQEVGYQVGETSRLHFVKFETKYIEDCLDFVRDNLVSSKEQMMGKIIKATGGGAYKYAPLIHDKLGLKVEKEDEMSCLIGGCNFLLKNIGQEAFMYRRHGEPEYEFQTADPHIFPYMLVNIGSGVSILKVESEERYERVGGTATGGGTFWGLGSLLTKAKGFDELLELAEKGDHRRTDLLVGDIYGGDYRSLGLQSDLIASSFGKVTHKPHGLEWSEADIARSLLFTISNDIGQIACLYAMMHNLHKVYFGGYFLRNHPLSMHTISYSINYWSKGTVESLFLRHEGYLGAIGAFLKGAAEQSGEQYSWQENYAGSSSLEPQPTSGVVVGAAQLEMDASQQRLSFCPLLADPHSYVPDTVDLNSDHHAREYWLKCFESSIDKYVERAVMSQPHSQTAHERANQFKENYLRRLHHLTLHPFAYGKLTVRSLLDTIEHLLREFDFPDPYILVKQQENEAALSRLEDRLKEVDSIEDSRQRWTELAVGMLAGNIFDWGARAIVDIMETHHQFGLQQAASKIPQRPWLMDDLDAWLDRVCQADLLPYRHAAVFIDNSGVDVVLGMIPFVRELVRSGTRVTVCANTHPALNDVTFTELEVILGQVATICPVIASSLKMGSLVPMETAQSGPCLDLSRLAGKLVDEMRDVDLLVLEGMGRCVHTNLYANFTCDSLRVACIKNTWLAERLGGSLFAAIFSYTTPSSSS